MQAVEPKLDVAAADEMLLVQAAKDGDIAAFEELVRRYDRKTFRVALQMTQNHEDAEDVVQECFLKAFRGLAQFQAKSRFSTWLFRIAVNESLMKLRKRRGFQVSLDGDDGSDTSTTVREIVDWGPNPEQLYRQSELREILRQALDELTPAYRTVFLLRDVEGFSIDETAEMLGLTVSAVKARLLRARLKLRERLNRHFGQKRSRSA